MAVFSTYSKARANFAKLCNQAADNREVIIISRRNSDDVALIAASELSSILETAHLLRSPQNAKRLMTALKRARSKKLKPKDIDTLRIEVGLHERKK